MRLRTILALELLLVAMAVTAGIYIGEKAGRKHEYDAWMNTLIDWGCAGHELKTGDIVIFGACNPVMLTPQEPKEDE